MRTVQSDRVEIHADMMLPELLRRYPQVRRVLDDYGLRGCGGPLGPAETIGYFARAHGVDEGTLVSELTVAAAQPAPAAPPAESADAREELADVIYRRFFKGGIVVVLTAGAVWGAWLLLRISLAGRFTGASIHEINAHGHAQIFGWVGLFVMGFAYQAFPRMKHSSLWRPDLANLTFYLMVVAIFARSVGEPLFRYAAFRDMALLASGVEFIAIVLFVVIILETLRRSGKPLEIHDRYIVASLFFFVLQAAYEAGLLYALTSAPTRDALLGIVATWQAPLRDIQIHGFAMLIILGVGLRMFPALFGFHAPGRRMARRSFYVLVAAIVGEVLAFLMMQWTGRTAWAGFWYASVIVLAATAIGLTLRWGLLARPTERDRSTKFIRAATVWLHISMLMLVAVPLYMYGFLPHSPLLSASGQAAVEMHFSHAYYGAVRHAITVGFISLTILGMAGKVVPTLKGVDIRQLSALWTPFVLVNIGCAMRVVFQVMTDLTARAYPVAGVSGLLEVTGIALWGVHLWRIMNRSEAAAAQHDTDAPITADETVASIVERFPETLPVLVAKGFAPLENPWLRKTLARTVSLRTAARMKELDPDSLVAELNGITAGAPGSAVSQGNASAVEPV
jgi:hypothetical protein